MREQQKKRKNQQINWITSASPVIIYQNKFHTVSTLYVTVSVYSMMLRFLFIIYVVASQPSQHNIFSNFPFSHRIYDTTDMMDVCDRSEEKRQEESQYKIRVVIFQFVNNYYVHILMYKYNYIKWRKINAEKR